MACLACPDHMTTRSTGSTAATDCIAAPGFVLRTTTGATPVDTVAACPLAFNCSKPALTLEGVEIQPGYWRAAHDTLNARACPKAKWCPGGAMYTASVVASAQAALQQGSPAGRTEDNVHKSHAANGLCAPGHVGPYCAVCIDDWYMVSDQCTKCPTAAAGELALALAFVFGVGLAAVLVLYFGYKKGKAWLARRAEAKQAKKGSTPLSPSSVWTNTGRGSAGSASSQQGEHPSVLASPHPGVMQQCGESKLGPGSSGVRLMAGKGGGATPGDRTAEGNGDSDNEGQPTEADDTRLQLQNDGFDETSEKANKMKGLLIKVCLRWELHSACFAARLTSRFALAGQAVGGLPASVGELPRFAISRVATSNGEVLQDIRVHQSVRPHHGRCCSCCSH